jgi:hypothetical protein
MEDENERMTEELKDKIHALKSLSIDIGTEVKYQDKMLGSMVSLVISTLHKALSIIDDMRKKIYFRMTILKERVDLYLIQ